jgi:hypothetical protein
MSNVNNNNSVRTGSGITLTGLVGMGLAAYLSFTLKNPIVWVAVHAIFGWLYVLYLCLGFGGGFPEGTF